MERKLAFYLDLNSVMCTEFASCLQELAVTHEGHQATPVADKHFNSHCTLWLKAMCRKTEMNMKDAKRNL
jgi:hypothetical protein